MLNTILFFIVIIVSNTVQVVTGFAGTMLAMPFSILLVGMDDAKAVLNAVAIVICAIVAIKNYRDIDKKELFKMSSLMLLGLVIGIYLLNIVSTDTLLHAFGALIISIALKKLFIKKEIKLPVFAMYIVIVFAGIIHGMFISGGSLLVIYAIHALKDKHKFRATLSVMWILLNGILFFTHLQSGFFTTEVTIMTIAAIPTALLSVYFGNKIYGKINQKVFLKITYILLLISGTILLV